MASIRLTDARLAWLKHVLAYGPGAQRAKSNTGYYCMQAGWTEWNLVNAQGEPMTMAEAKGRYGDKFWELAHVKGERLTFTGRRLAKEIAGSRHPYADSREEIDAILGQGKG